MDRAELDRSRTSAGIEPRRRRLERRHDEHSLAEIEPLGRRRRHLGHDRPDPHARAVTERNDEATAARMWLMRESVGRCTTERDLPRVDGDVRRGRLLRPRSRREPPPSSTTSVSPFAPRRAVPAKQRRAGEARDERVGGAATSSAARPALEDPALDDHADPVGERGGVLEVVRDEDRSAAPSSRSSSWSSTRTAGLACGRRAPRAARRAGARPGRARARARARRAGARRRRARVTRAPREVARSGSARAARRPAASRRGAEADVRARRRGAGTARTPGTGSRPGAAPAARRCPRSCRARRVLVERHEPARRGRSRPATTRRTVVFPAPDGPTSATVSPPARPSARRDASKLRRGWVKSDAERHRVRSLTERRTSALMTTSTALIARATSKSTSNCS